MITDRASQKLTTGGQAQLHHPVWLICALVLLVFSSHRPSMLYHVDLPSRRQEGESFLVFVRNVVLRYQTATSYHHRVGIVSTKTISALAIDHLVNIAEIAIAKIDMCRS